MAKRHFWIYFLRGESSGRIKIGLAECPKVRARQIQHTCPESIKLWGTIDLGVCSRAVAGARELEIHTQFRHMHAHGEVFEEYGPLLNFISERKSEHKCSLCPSVRKLTSPWDRYHKPKIVSELPIPWKRVGVVGAPLKIDIPCEDRPFIARPWITVVNPNDKIREAICEENATAPRVRGEETHRVWEDTLRP